MRRYWLPVIFASFWFWSAQAQTLDIEKHLLPSESVEAGDRSSISIRVDEYWQNRLGRSNNDTCAEFNRSSISDQMNWMERGCRCLTREEAASLTPEREALAQACLTNGLDLCEGSEKIWPIKARCYREAVRTLP
jgi:hypothetical protein